MNPNPAHVLIALVLVSPFLGPGLYLAWRLAATYEKGASFGALERG
ncbi:MAG: hypothetical protein U0230_17545 [Polyangiales bacterium]